MLTLPTCKQVAEQLSENIDEPATGLRKWRLKIHLLMCTSCKLYGKQINLCVKTINLLDDKIKPSESVKEEALEQYRDYHKSQNHSH